MNTGIGDAVNLAWKLASVLRGANPRLLDSYEQERIAFARRLVETTDKAFTQVTSSRATARLDAVATSAAGCRRFFSRTSQKSTSLALSDDLTWIAIQYRGSAISSGIAGRVLGADADFACHGSTWTMAAPITSRRCVRSTGRCTCTARSQAGDRDAVQRAQVCAARLRVWSSYATRRVASECGVPCAARWLCGAGVAGWAEPTRSRRILDTVVALSIACESTTKLERPSQDTGSLC